MLTFEEKYESLADPLERLHLVALATELLGIELEADEAVGSKSGAFQVKVTFGYLEGKIRALETRSDEMPLAEYNTALWHLYRSKIEELFFWCEKEGFLLDGWEVVHQTPILRRKRGLPLPARDQP